MIEGTAGQGVERARKQARRRGTPLPEHDPEADQLAACLTRYGVVLSIPSAVADLAGGGSGGRSPASTQEAEPAVGGAANTGPEADEALLLRLSAQKLWAEGRSNPVWFRCATWLGTWLTEDRLSWRTTDGIWLAQLERSTNGRHVWLAFYQRGTYRGYQDAAGFHHPSTHSRARRPRPVARSLPLPLAG
jgi:hypothetical protein